MSFRIPIKELEFSFSRSSGAGGQNVNKLSTRVTLRWDLSKTQSLPPQVIERFKKSFSRVIVQDGHVQITSQRFRSQGRNVADTIEKLEAMISEVEAPPKPRKPTRPKKSAVERRIKEKKAKGEKKRLRQGFP